MNATKTETDLGLTKEIISGLDRALGEFQGRIDDEIRKGADPAFLYHSEDSPIRDIRLAQAWLARVTHQIHREHVAAEESR